MATGFTLTPYTGPFPPAVLLFVGGARLVPGFAPPPPPCPPCPPLPPPPPIPTVIPNPLPNSGFGNVDFGQDFDFLTDLNPQLTLVSGLANLGQAIVHRLQTPRGGLSYAPNYGTDIRVYLNDTVTPARIAKLNNEVVIECLKDERIDSASCSAVFVPQTKSLTVTLNLTTAAGPFVLVLAVTAVSVTVLSLDPTA